MVGKGIPEGWLDFAAVGKTIPRTRIICFKVPLKEEISRSLPESERFTPKMLMAEIPNLAGVIDLTNTTRYYNKQVFLECGILHEKILCPGHVIPPPKVVSAFENAMDHFWSTAESLGKLVGVHCTHGVNRTGYLVCRYLVERRGFQFEEAIKLFGESRGHQIQRQSYIDDLRTLKPQHCLTSYQHCHGRGGESLGRNASKWLRSSYGNDYIRNEDSTSWRRKYGVERGTARVVASSYGMPPRSHQSYHHGPFRSPDYPFRPYYPRDHHHPNTTYSHFGAGRSYYSTRWH